ncbi:MAG: RecX family transcriptional regulator [Chloroflexi bacterium]|nr:RecX family transcriptional regulator [Chloroflexota bacterium]
MPVITALEVHRRKKECVKLFLDEKFAMNLPLIEAAQLRQGQFLTQAEADALAEAGLFQSAFDRAVRFLSFRPRSTAEVRRYLADNAIEEPVVQAVIEGLRERAYLDDLAFASFWLENRSRFKPMAPRALRYELRQKGVDDAVIDAVLSEFDADGAAYRAAKGRIHRYRGYTRQVFRRKLSGMLRRRGFDSETINDVIMRLQHELDESEAGFFASDMDEKIAGKAPN